MDFYLMIFLLQSVVFAYSKTQIKLPQVYEDVDESESQIVSQRSNESQRFKLDQPQINLQKLRYIEQQNIDTQNGVKVKHHLRKGKIYSTPNLRKREIGLQNQPPLYFIHQARPVINHDLNENELKFIRNYLGKKQQLQALTALIGKNPDAQLEGLNHLLQNSNDKPITENILDVTNPQKQPNIKVEHGVHHEPISYQRVEPRTDHLNHLAVMQIEKEINNAVRMHAQEALIHAQEQALKVVEAQHQILAVAKAQAEKEAFEKVHQTATYNPVLVESSVNKFVDNNHDGVSITNLDKLINSRVKRGAEFYDYRDDKGGNGVKISSFKGEKIVSKRSKRDDLIQEYYDDEFEEYEIIVDPNENTHNLDIVNPNDRMDNPDNYDTSDILNKLKQNVAIENKNDHLYANDRNDQKSDYVNDILAYLGKAGKSQNRPETEKPQVDVNYLSIAGLKNPHTFDYRSSVLDENDSPKQTNVNGILSLIGQIGANRSGLVIIQPKPKPTSHSPPEFSFRQDFQNNPQPPNNIDDILKLIGQNNPTKAPLNDQPQTQTNHEYINGILALIGQTNPTTPKNAHSEIYQDSFQNPEELMASFNQNTPNSVTHSELNSENDNMDDIFSLVDQIEHPHPTSPVKVPLRTTQKRIEHPRVPSPTKIPSRPTQQELKSIEDILAAFSQKPLPISTTTTSSYQNDLDTYESQQKLYLNNMLNGPKTNLKENLSSKLVFEKPSSMGSTQKLQAKLPNASQQSVNLVNNILSYVDQNKSPQENSEFSDEEELDPQREILDGLSYLAGRVKPSLSILANASHKNIEYFRDILNSNAPQPILDPKVVSAAEAQPYQSNLNTAKTKPQNVNIDEFLAKINKYSENQEFIKTVRNGERDPNEYKIPLIDQTDQIPAASVMQNVFANSTKSSQTSNASKPRYTLPKIQKQFNNVISTQPQTTVNPVDKEALQRLKDVYDTIAFMKANEQHQSVPSFEKRAKIRNTRNITDSPAKVENVLPYSSFEIKGPTPSRAQNAFSSDQIRNPTPSRDQNLFSSDYLRNPAPSRTQNAFSSDQVLDPTPSRTQNAFSSDQVKGPTPSRAQNAFSSDQIEDPRPPRAQNSSYFGTFQVKGPTPSRATIKNIEGSLSFLGQIKVDHGNKRTQDGLTQQSKPVKIQIENSGDILAFLGPSELYEETSTVLPEELQMEHPTESSPQRFKLLRDTRPREVTTPTSTTLAQEHYDDHHMSEILASLNEMKLNQEQIIKNISMLHDSSQQESSYISESRPPPPRAINLKNILPLIQETGQRLNKIPLVANAKSNVEKFAKLLARLSRLQASGPAYPHPEEENAIFNEMATLMKQMKRHQSHQEPESARPNLAPENIESIVSVLEQMKATEDSNAFQISPEISQENYKINEISAMIAQHNALSGQSPQVKQELLNRVVELLSQVKLKGQTEDTGAAMMKIQEMMLNLENQNEQLQHQDDSDDYISRLTLGEQLALIMRNMNKTRNMEHNEHNVILKDVKDYLSLVEQNEKMRNLLEVLPTESNPKTDPLFGLTNQNYKEEVVDEPELNLADEYPDYPKRLERSPNRQNINEILAQLEQNRQNSQANYDYPSASYESSFPEHRRFWPFSSQTTASPYVAVVPVARNPKPNIPRYKRNRYEGIYPVSEGAYLLNSPEPLQEEEYFASGSQFSQQLPQTRPNSQNLANFQSTKATDQKDPNLQNMVDFISLLKRIKDSSNPKAYDNMLDLLTQKKDPSQDSDEMHEAPSQTNQTLRDMMPLLEKNKPVNLIVINNSNDNHKNNQHKNFPAKPRVPPSFYHSRRRYEPPRPPDWVLASRRSDYVPHKPDYTQLSNRPYVLSRY